MQDDQLFLAQEQEDFEDAFGNEQVLQALRQTHRTQRNQIKEICSELKIIFEL
jgi:hypothetical protein